MSMRSFKIKDVIYHGTIFEIDDIDLTRGRGYKDFGKGFYLAYNKEHSIRIMNKKYRISNRRNKTKKYKNLYAFNTSQEELEKCKYKVFNEPDIEWLDFVLMCRANDNTPHDYDIVIGPTADDDTAFCLNAYREGVYGEVGSYEAKRTLINLLNVREYGIQVFIGTEKGLSILSNKRKV